MKDKFNIAIVCGKLGDVDGVSLEVDKWIEVLKKCGHNIITIAGYYGSSVNNIENKDQILVDDLNFRSKDQKKYESLVFPHLSKHPPFLSQEDIERITHEIEMKGNDTAEVDQAADQSLQRRSSSAADY